MKWPWVRRRRFEAQSERLVHASGALGDIGELVTSCVTVGVDGEFRDICKTILGRILSSAHREHSKPTWYRHDWEEAEFIDYFQGRTKACASDEPCRVVALQLKQRAARKET